MPCHEEKEKKKMKKGLNKCRDDEEGGNVFSHAKKNTFLQRQQAGYVLSLPFPRRTTKVVHHVVLQFYSTLFFPFSYIRRSK